MPLQLLKKNETILFVVFHMLLNNFCTFMTRHKRQLTAGWNSSSTEFLAGLHLCVRAEEGLQQRPGAEVIHARLPLSPAPAR